MEKTKVVVTRGKKEKYAGDVLIHFLQEDTEEPDVGIEDIWSCFEEGYSLGDFKGKCGEMMVAYPAPQETTIPYKVKRLAICGLGKPVDEHSNSIKENIRLVGGHIGKFAQKIKAERIMLKLPEVPGLTPVVTAESLLEGVLLADYRFNKYKSENGKNKPYTGLKEIKIHVNSPPSKIRAGVDRALSAAYAARRARDMANEPGNGWTAEQFADFARDLAKRYELKCKIFEKKDIRRLKMGGVLAVNQGSAVPPKVVVLEYRVKKKKAPTLLVVGKGLTFDSGGVSLKPAAGMQDMKYDMCGGGAALSVMQAIGEEQPHINVVSIIPTTDNMSGSSALKPGDIIRHYNGVTSEIINTDAEGRLILADALAYGIEKYKPDCVVDLATLTGAVIVGLGHHYTGILGNDDSFVNQVIEAGSAAGEPIWQLPLGKEYTKQIESKVADIKNTGGKAAGTITAAAYLQKFVGDTAWAHLDIAGTSWDYTEKSYVPKGPSGVGVRTLLELVRNWQPEKK